MAVRTRLDTALRLVCLTLFIILVAKLGILHYNNFYGYENAGATVRNLKPDQQIDTYETNYKQKESEIKKAFERRRKLVNEICEYHFSPDYGLNWKSFAKNRNEASPSRLRWWERIFVVPKAKLVFCSIPQVDTPEWRRHLTNVGFYMSNLSEFENNKPTLLLQNDFDLANLSNSYIFPLANYEPDEARAYLKGFKRVIWVRDPLERLISAWLDKLQNWDHFQQERLDILLKSQQANLTEEQLEKLMPVPLRVFFSFLTSEPSSLSYDVNWRPYRDLCAVCQLPYDYVIYRETPQNEAILPFEVDYVFRQALDERNDLPRFALKQPIDHDRLNNKVPQLRELSRTLLHRVLDIYKLDYALFGFERPDKFNNL